MLRPYANTHCYTSRPPPRRYWYVSRLTSGASTIRATPYQGAGARLRLDSATTWYVACRCGQGRGVRRGTRHIARQRARAGRNQDGDRAGYKACDRQNIGPGGLARRARWRGPSLV